MEKIMIDEKSPSKMQTFLRRLSSEAVLGTLVALLSVLVALAAYQGSLSDSQESDKNVEGQKQLTEANAMYLETNQFVIYDFTMYDGWYVNQDTNPDIAEYYQGSYSDNLISSIDRPDGPFDSQYYQEMYADADSTYNEAQTYFDEAQAAGDRANKMQLVVLVFAVGLALAAYGSLMAPEKAIRAVFTIGSIAALIAGLISYFTA
jgi:hypothetical protein